jgi:hypothetical protein
MSQIASLLGKADIGARWLAGLIYLGNCFSTLFILSIDRHILGFPVP